MDVPMNDDLHLSAPARSAFPEIATLIPNKWSWQAKDEEKWVSVPFDWQAFMDCWMDPLCAADLNQKTFPYKLQIFPTSSFSTPELTMTSIGATPLLNTFNSKILVLERYAFLYHGLNGTCEQDYGGGVILGGQLGIVQLIWNQQPVVLHLPQQINIPTILFYHGKAWCCPLSNFDFQAMPSGPINPDTKGPKPIFVLVDSSSMEPLGMTKTMGWLIYSVSPKPILFHEFRKRRNPFLWGLDLWTLEQLHDALKLHVQWPGFFKGLTALLEGHTDRKNQWALQVAVSVRNNSKYKEWPQETVDDWIEILLNNAIHWSGRTPREVFQTILAPVDAKHGGNLPSNPLSHVAHLLSWAELIAYRSADPISHGILAIQMQPASLMSYHNSNFDFIVKNPALWEVMDEYIFRSNVAKICSVFTSLRTLKLICGSGTALTDHIFADYALGHMIADNPFIPLKPMVFQNGKAAQPTFTADLNIKLSLVPTGIYPGHRCRCPVVDYMPTKGKMRRPWYKWNYNNGPLEVGFIFVPVASNHPLFDAFFLDVPDLWYPHLWILWIIQFTASWEHKDAVKGLLNVRKLLKKQAGLINDQKIEVEVRWVLMKPTPVSNVSDREWQMPPGWNESVIQFDHRGFVWLQEMDMTGTGTH
ncbi:hypothetical protein BT96DRAFT_994013 [Gymnopus androsaceus JB14]|uniref:Uncharacterized protein n=1 Tax=Gymnopus androsaceus JB14 TaxID=1447944 RepID=A0A6A4HQU0_9AGAR|nr:hypothetical protein BT96DRAFT_994013 [Gymnopus androsaceus JB14]